MDISNSAICITAGEQSENHAGMEINGNGLSDKGFTIEELLDIKENLSLKGVECQYYCLNEYLPDKFKNDDKSKGQIAKAGILFIRDGISKLTDFTGTQMFEEQIILDWDKQYWDTRRNKVLNKRARYNLCYSDENQLPDYQNKKGRIVSYKDLPILNQWRNKLSILFGKKAENLELEGNLYYDIKKCGIGFHGDGERKKVIACSLGGSRPIHWQWYHQNKPIGDRIKFSLNNGDIYIMSEKASGYDWKKRNKVTLRHAAGEKYVFKENSFKNLKKELGTYFGYPECCQDFFIEKRVMKKDLSLTQNQNKCKSNGFIPCPKCADYLVENNLKIVSLIKNRHCPHSFPTSYCYNLECSCVKPKSVLKKLQANI